MKIKTFISMVYLSVFFLLPGLNQAEAAQSWQKKGVALKLTGGMSYLLLDEWNYHLRGYSAFHDRAAFALGGTMEGEFKSIKWGLDFEGDVIIYLNSRLGINIGSGYISGKRGPDANKITYYLPWESGTNTLDMQISAIPVKLGVYYCLSRSSKFRLFLSGGIGYYFAKISEDMKSKWDGNWIDGYQESKFDITKSIAFVVEGSGRYAKITDFEGDYDATNSFGVNTSTQGGLYYYERLTSYGYVPYIGIQEEPPSGPNYRKVRKATVDLSGFTVKIGIKIRLF
jgi:hypothetical protein